MLKKTISVIVTLGLLLSLMILPVQAEESYANRIIGDVNGDSSVEIDDVTFLQRNLAEIELPFVFVDDTADADEDGYVTILDATHIQRWMLGLDQKMNIGDLVHLWFDKSVAEKESYDNGEELIITRICQDHFFADPLIPMYVEYRINGSISDYWCVGDHVYCTFNNIYCDPSITSKFVEADLISIEEPTFEYIPNEPYKPVIYLYPEEETEVDVRLDLNGSFTHTYPAYNDGWRVTASPDGTLTDDSGITYPYLFWEGKMDADYDLSEGFCVKGEDTEAFLHEKLAVLGLSDKEIADFNEFWLSAMKKNPYNVISFQSDAYTEAAKLTISPQPDSVIRVYMTWYPSDEAVDIPAQELTTPERCGFTAVEWGGALIG